MPGNARVRLPPCSELASGPLRRAVIVSETLLYVALKFDFPRQAAPAHSHAERRPEQAERLSTPHAASRKEPS